MRRAFPIQVLLIVLAVLVAACGDDTADTPVPIPTNASATTSTSFAAATTTVAHTTTSTWPELPDIDVGPIPALPTATLTEDFGGPSPIATACIEIDVTEDTGDPAEMSEALSNALGFMGIEVVDADCDLEMRVELDGGRYSAHYTVFGTCYTGWNLFGEFTASAVGLEWTWEIDENTSPPMTITHCPGDGPVPAGAWARSFTETLGDLFGSLGRVAGGWAYTFDMVLGVEVVDESIYEILIAALYEGAPEDRCRAVTITLDVALQAAAAADGDPDSPGIDSLAPYLVDTYLELAEADFDGYMSGVAGTWNCYDQLPIALEIVLAGEGVAFYFPEEWAEWWLAREE